METHDLTSPDYYSSHLADVNTARAVRANEDIYNSSGMLLVREGHAISNDVAQKLLGHKLVKPLETQVNVDNQVGHDQLFEDISEVVRQAEDLRTIDNALDLRSSLYEHCRRYSQFDLLMQKCTVLKDRLPKEYDKACFSAWLCLALAHRLQWSGEERAAAFLGGLSHDLGMLHLDPELLNHDGAYNPEQWRAMQSHTLIAATFLRFVPGLPAATQRAVLEHHERPDGSGYPYGHFGDSLSLIGQAVAISDVLYAVRRRSHCSLDRPVQSGDILPILQVNSVLFPTDIYKATVGLLRLAPKQTTRQTHTRPLAEVCGDLLHRLGRQRQVYDILIKLAGALRDPEAPRLKVASAMLNNLYLVTTTSGLLSEPIMRWLEHLQQEPADTVGPEVAELELMANELQWQLRQLHRASALAAEEVDAIRPEQSEALTAAVRETEGIFDDTMDA